MPNERGRSNVYAKLPAHCSILAGHGAVILSRWYPGRLAMVALKYDPRTWCFDYGEPILGAWYLNAGPISVSVATVGGWR